MKRLDHKRDKELLFKTMAEKYPKRWGTLSKEHQAQFIDEIYKEILPELDEVESIIREAHSRRSDARFFLFGVIVAIVGGFVSNIIHDWLKNYDGYYVIPAIATFVLLIWVFWKSTGTKISKLYHSNPLLAALLDELKKKDA